MFLTLASAAHLKCRHCPRRDCLPTGELQMHWPESFSEVHWIGQHHASMPEWWNMSQVLRITGGRAESRHRSHAAHRHQSLRSRILCWQLSVAYWRVDWRKCAAHIIWRILENHGKPTSNIPYQSVRLIPFVNALNIDPLGHCWISWNAWNRQPCHSGPWSAQWRPGLLPMVRPRSDRCLCAMRKIGRGCWDLKGRTWWDQYLNLSNIHWISSTPLWCP